MDIAIKVPPCLKKTAHSTRKLAKNAVTVALKRSGVRLEIYRCEHCSMWHTTRWAKSSSCK